MQFVENILMKPRRLTFPEILEEFSLLRAATKATSEQQIQDSTFVEAILSRCQKCIEVSRSRNMTLDFFHQNHCTYTTMYYY